MSSPPDPPDPFELPEWAPTTTDVAALLRARTKDGSGAELGDFTDATRPTGDAVSLLIGFGCSDVISAVGGAELPTYLWGEARGVAALKTALLVEASFWPEQVGTDRSPWNSLYQLWQVELRTLSSAASASGGAGTILTGSLVTPPDWKTGWPDPIGWPPDWWQRNLDNLEGYAGFAPP